MNWDDAVFVSCMVLGNEIYKIKLFFRNIYARIVFYKHDRVIKTYLEKLKER